MHVAESPLSPLIKHSANTAPPNMAISNRRFGWYYYLSACFYVKVYPISFNRSDPSRDVTPSLMLVPLRSHFHDMGYR
jgi:hypothetical protein